MRLDRNGAFASFDLLGTTRVAVAVLNFPLAYLSYRNPQEPDWAAGPGFLGCALFLLWAVVSHLLHRRTRSSDVTSAALTLADIVAAVGLVAVTGGALSPFGSWISFMALGTVYVSRQRYAVVIALAAVAAILAIGTHHQSITSLTIVRASWAATFALFGYLVRAAQAGHLRLLSALETFTAEVGTLNDDAAAMEAFRRAAQSIAEPSNVVIRLERLGLRARPRLETGSDWLRIPIASGSHDLGEALLTRARKFTPDERMALQVAGERLASALVRMEANRDMIDEAVRQERLALADELHDTTIQTLTALDLGAAILRRQMKDNPDAQAIAEEIGAQAREHIAHVRRFLRDSVTDRVPGPESLAALLEERWSGSHELDIPSGTRLSEARWRLVGLMAREGLNNAARHGGAHQVRLVVRAEDDGFEARLEADGASPPAETRTGYGLSRLRAVASAQRASVDLRPGEGGGSVLAVRAREENER